MNLQVFALKFNQIYAEILSGLANVGNNVVFTVFIPKCNTILYCRLAFYFIADHRK